MGKTLILIRHGQRDNTRRELDNGLTEKGREQARSVRRFFTDRFQAEDFKSGLWLLSSPKLRCVETLQPLAKALERKVDIHPGLDEQGVRESRASFDQRVHGFLHEWTQAKIPLTILCSHGDWLPAATYHLLGAASEQKKGSWLELEWEGGAAALRWYIPSFKVFYR
ncbi:MAG: histidine phosphatase family protein [Bdellovibrionales bacterium]|nr:histidine phosphatase family protein [Bdellovibrionales bacterium]